MPGDCLDAAMAPGIGLPHELEVIAHRGAGETWPGRQADSRRRPPATAGDGQDHG